MSPTTERFPVHSWARCWASLFLSVLFLEPQLQPVRAAACPPSRPADKPHAATAPAPSAKESSTTQVGIDLLVVKARGRLAGQFARYVLGHSKQATIEGGSQPCLYSGILDYGRDTRALRAFLKELQREGLAQIMAEPRLVSLSGRAASYLDNGEQAIPVPAGLGQIGVQFEEFDTRVNFTPSVLDNGKIHLEIEPEVSRLDPAASTTIGGTVVPGRVTQRVRTTVEIEDGKMLLIGGLLQHQVNATEERVPILGDMPIIGLAFSKKTFREVNTELLILITPHVIKPAAEHKQ